MSSVHDMTGAVLADRYELQAHVSSGRFGDLWKARVVGEQNEVGVRLIQPELYQDTEALQRFEREVTLLRGWEHPNLMRVLDSGYTVTGHPWMVTELHQGRTLYDHITDLTLPLDVICHIASQIAWLLSAAHSRGMVHRGLTPDAVVVVEEDGDPWRVKMVDFGLVHAMGDSGMEPLTQTGIPLGTAEYLAPEYITDNHLDARSDIYVLGVLVFEMLVGQPPFIGGSTNTVIRVAEQPAPAPSKMTDREIPAWVDGIVLALLAKDPADRPASAELVATVFENQARALRTG